MDGAQENSLYSAVVEDAAQMVRGVRAGTAPQRSVGAYEQQRVRDSIREKTSRLRPDEDGNR